MFLTYFKPVTLQLHHTKGIVLRTVKYGETSVITSVYTELFGVQSYLVKGVYKVAKKATAKAGFFQPGAILALTVYHNELKQLQFVNEYHWAYLYENLLFDVVRNTVAMYIIEVLQHTLKQPEANVELFFLIENTLIQLDKGNATLVANLPLYFLVHLGAELGFQLQGEFCPETTILDLLEGKFVPHLPNHPHYLVGELAQFSSQLSNIHFYSDLESIALNRTLRRQLLQAYQEYLTLHISDFGSLKSLAILQEILG